MKNAHACPLVMELGTTEGEYRCKDPNCKYEHGWRALKFRKQVRLEGIEGVIARIENGMRADQVVNVIGEFWSENHQKGGYGNKGYGKKGTHGKGGKQYQTKGNWNNKGKDNRNKGFGKGGKQHWAYK